MLKYLTYLSLLFIGVMALSCNSDYVPKPQGYFRISFPEKAYVKFDSTCSYTFEYPKYGKIEPTSGSHSEPCWINISFPAFNGKIHLSYKTIENNLTQLTEDSRTLAYKHTVKADAIDEKVYYNPTNSTYGILYDIKGNAASSIQFFVTDSVSHFIRGALYFENQPNKDSLAPVIAFFREDILHLIETLEWK